MNQYTVYHKAVWMPENLKRLAFTIKPKLTKHAKREAATDKLGYIRLPNSIRVDHCNIIEVYTNNQGQIEKLLIRQPHDALNDACLIIKPDGLIITCWLNRRTDSHKTLDTTRYAKKGEQPNA
jgi:hypothetical protein